MQLRKNAIGARAYELHGAMCGPDDWSVRSLLSFSLAEIRCLGFGMGIDHIGNSDRVNDFLSDDCGTEAGFMLARHIANDARLGVIEMCADLVPYPLLVEMTSTTRVIRDISKTSPAVGVCCDQWNLLVPLSANEQQFFIARRQARKLKQNEYKDASLTLSASSYVNLDLYQQVRELYPYPSGSDWIFAGYKPDVYFTIIPSMDSCTHGTICHCSFHVVGNHPVTAGSGYFCDLKGVRAKVEFVVAKILQDFVWSEVDGLMSRTDRCEKRRGESMYIAVESETNAEIPFLDETRKTIAYQESVIMKASELVRGNLGYANLMDHVLSSSRYSGTILNKVHLRLSTSLENCRH